MIHLKEWSPSFNTQKLTKNYILQVFIYLKKGARKERTRVLIEKEWRK